MDLRDFMRGFFGYSRPPPPGPNNQWPPPPPINEFDIKGGNESGDVNVFGGGIRQDMPRVDELDIFSRNRRGGTSGTPFDRNQGFVFSDMFSIIGEMFQEMERSMHEFDEAFNNQSYDFSQIDAGSSIESPASQSQSPSVSIRDSVLKGLDPKYYPIHKDDSEKVDRNLDELYRQSKLDLSELPVPDPEDCNPSHNDLSLAPYCPQKGMKSGFQFQRTFQTYSFRNGRWEGEIIQEDGNGRQITKYYQDKDGNRHETTEFIPQAPTPQDTNIHPSMNLPLDSHGPSRMLQFFDRIFKPRM